MKAIKNITITAILVFSLLNAGLAQAALYVTFLGNEGYLLSDGKDKIIIDGFLGEAYALFQGLDEKSASAVIAAKDDFADIDLALVSHMHFEHFQPDTACKFIKASPATLMVTSPQVISILKDRCKPFAKNHKNLKPVITQAGIMKAFTKDGAKVEIFSLSHGTGKFSSLQHLGHLMTVGGKTIVHIGDAATDPADFLAAGLQNRKIDVLIAPYTFYTRAAGQLIISKYLNAPIKIVGHIPPKEFDSIVAAVREDYPDVVVFDQRMEVKTFE